MVMIQVNVVEMKARLSEYLDRVARGEHIIVCRHNKPVAELRPLTETRREPRPIGPIRGETQFEIPPSFFEPLPDDELDLWEGMASRDPLSAERPKHAVKAPKVAEDRTEYGKRPHGSRRGRRS